MNQKSKRKHHECKSKYNEILSATKTFDTGVYLFNCDDCEIIFT